MFFSLCNDSQRRTLCVEKESAFMIQFYFLFLLFLLLNGNANINWIMREMKNIPYTYMAYTYRKLPRLPLWNYSRGTVVAACASLQFIVFTLYLVIINWFLFCAGIVRTAQEIGSYKIYGQQPPLNISFTMGKVKITAFRHKHTCWFASLINFAPGELIEFAVI